MSTLSNFTSSEIQAIRMTLSYRAKIEENLAKFESQQTNSHKQNMQTLIETVFCSIDIESVLKEKFINSFQTFLALEENIPIEINFKKLKYEQLTSLINQWEASLKQPSLLRASERLYSIQHRNILFNRIFVEERQNIEGYFDTLSQKKMLKGVDLYQLLVDILSNYFLYEYNSDHETFFEKVNSFNSFLQIVEKFIHSQKRIIIDNKSKDILYIKLYEFEALMYFWESINPQLQLRSHKRFSNCCKQVQTQRHLMVNPIQQETQTIKIQEKPLLLQEIINLTLKQLNKLTEDQTQVQKLQIIQDICEFVRKQKIKLLHFQKNKKSTLFSPSLNPSTLYLDENHRESQNTQQRQSRFLKEKEQIQQQKTQRIMTKGYSGSEYSKDSMSKKKDISRSRLQMQDLKVSPSKGKYSIQIQEKQWGSQRKSKVRHHTQLNEKERHLQVENHKKELNHNQLAFVSQNSKNRYKVNEDIQSKPHQHYSESYLRTNQLKANNHLESEKSNQIQQGEQHDEDLIRNQTQNSNLSPSILSLLEQVYIHYSDKAKKTMNIELLNQFFTDIGIIEQNQTYLTFRLIKSNNIKNLNKIKLIEFIQIMEVIMREDEDLNYDVISEFVDIYAKDRRIPKKEEKSLVNPHDFNIKIKRQNLSEVRNPRVNPYPYTESKLQKPQQQIKRTRYLYTLQYPGHEERTNSKSKSSLCSQNKAKIPQLNFQHHKFERYSKY